MTRTCTHCGKEFTGRRKTCSRACLRQRHRAGADAGNRTQAEIGRWWTPRGTGDGRTIQTEHGLEVLDPVALAAQGIALVDCYGKPWGPL